MEVNEPIKNFEILLAKDNVDEKKQSQQRQQKKSRLKVELECKLDLIIQEESETF